MFQKLLILLLVGAIVGVFIVQPAFTAIEQIQDALRIVGTAT